MTHPLQPCCSAKRNELILIPVCLAMVFACQRSSDENTSAPTEAQSGSASSAPVAASTHRIDERFNQINREMNRARKLTPSIVDSLKKLHEDAPGHQPTIQLLTKAYIKREDWNALVELLSEKPAQLRTTKEKLQLATVLVRAQRFDEGLETVEPLVENTGSSGGDAEAAWLAGYASFHTDQLDRAATFLDANLEQVLAAGHEDALLVRGLIYFRNGQLTEAEQLLSRLVTANETHGPGHEALGRVLVAAGEDDRGQEYIRRADQIREAATSAERQALLMAAMTSALNTAWERQDLEACERHITEMLPMATVLQQVELYKYLASVRTKQGRQDEAQQALDKSRRLSASKP